VKFIVTFTADEDGGYTVECPALPGCISHGATVEEATANIKEAIELSLETRAELGIAGYDFSREVEIAS
jgi:predicted RNase H-like HicB family nuclease